eukprot:COSAG01_NODE_873_length_12981_cov_34.559929_8_plen_1504_part_00
MSPEQRSPPGDLAAGHADDQQEGPALPADLGKPMDELSPAELVQWLRHQSVLSPAERDGMTLAFQRLEVSGRMFCQLTRDQLQCFLHGVPSTTAAKLLGFRDAALASHTLEILRLQETTPHRGIRNLGNTCFVNATLQALFGVLEDGDMTSSASITELGTCLCQVFEAMGAPARGGATAVEPEDLLRLLRGVDGYNHGQQMDAHEFLCLVFRQLPHLNAPFTFSERTLSSEAAAMCHTSTVAATVVAGTGSAQYRRGFSVDALVHFSYAGSDTPVLICGDLAPELLCVVLKRFSTDAAGASQKQQCGVNLRKHLSIFAPDGRCLRTYRLAGTVDHVGQSVTNGHYTAHSLRSTAADTNPVWVHFDDAQQPNVIAEKAVLERSGHSAYVLLYRRCGGQEPGMSYDDLMAEVSAVKAAASWPDERQAHGDAAIAEVMKLKDRLPSLDSATDPWVLRMFVDMISRRLDESTEFSPRLISFAVNAVFGDPPRIQPAPPLPLVLDDADVDVDRMELWNDRKHWAIGTKNPAVIRMLVFRVVLKHPVWRDLLKHRLNDPNMTLNVSRDCQSGKSMVTVVMAWLSNVCYGQAAFVLLRSGPAAKADYEKLSAATVSHFNDLICQALVGYSRTCLESGGVRFEKCDPAMYDARIIRDPRADDRFARNGMLEQYLLHPFHLHCGDKLLRNDAAQRVLRNRHPIMYSRLSTASNIHRMQSKEIRIMAEHYGADEFGFLNMTLLVDEIQMLSKLGTRANEEFHAPHSEASELMEAVTAACESEDDRDSRFAAWEAHVEAASREATGNQDLPISRVDRPRSSFSATIRGQIRISATTVSSELTLDNDFRHRASIELAVDADYCGFATAKGINQANVIEPTIVKQGPDLAFVEEGDYPDCHTPVGLQMFVVDAVRAELSRKGYAHTLIHSPCAKSTETGRASNAGMLDHARFFVDLANHELPGVPVVAITAYMWTTAGSKPGGPWLVFSDAALCLREEMSRVARDLFVDAPQALRRGQGSYQRSVAPRADQIAFARASELGPGIEQNMRIHECDPSLQNCLQMPKNTVLYLPRILRLLHETVERLQFDKSTLKLITIGNGVLKVGLTPKSDNHMMSVTTAVLNASKRQIDNFDGESAFQSFGGRLCGTRANCPYYDRRGHDRPPALVMSDAASAKLMTAKWFQSYTVHAIMSKRPGVQLEDAILGKDYHGMADIDMGYQHFQDCTAKFKRSHPDMIGPADRFRQLAVEPIDGQATKGTGLVSKGREFVNTTCAPRESGGSHDVDRSLRPRWKALVDACRQQTNRARQNRGRYIDPIMLDRQMEAVGIGHVRFLLQLFERCRRTGTHPDSAERARVRDIVQYGCAYLDRIHAKQMHVGARAGPHAALTAIGEVLASISTHSQRCTMSEMASADDMSEMASADDDISACACPQGMGNAPAPKRRRTVAAAEKLRRLRDEHVRATGCIINQLEEEVEAAEEAAEAAAEEEEEEAVEDRDWTPSSGEDSEDDMTDEEWQW